MKHPNETVIFEGGLGSQLLPLLRALKLHNERTEFNVSFDYFTSDLSDSNMVIRPWRLDQYGYDMNEIFKLRSKNGRRKFPKVDSRATNDWGFGRAYGTQLVPVDSDSVTSLLLANSINPNEPYTVIHLRRGDYLKVSSRVVADSEFAEIIYKLRNQITDQVVFVSDSKISIKKNPKLKELMKHSRFKFYFIQGLDYDEIAIHNLMRCANILICSNSTFSFSAAILSHPDSISFAPIDFFDPTTMEQTNKKFRSAGNFFLLD